MTDIWIEGDDGNMFIEMVEGDKKTFSFRWQGATDITSVSSVTVWRSGEDITSTAMPSGTHSASADIITMKELVAIAGDASQKYVVAIKAVVDGNTETRLWLVKIKSPSVAL